MDRLTIRGRGCVKDEEEEGMGLGLGVLVDCPTQLISIWIFICCVSLQIQKGTQQGYLLGGYQLWIFDLFEGEL